MANKKDIRAEQSYYQTRELGEEWNEMLLKINRESPVESGGFRMFFDRSPDIFTIPKLTSHSYKCGGLFRRDELLGYAIATFQKRFIDDQQLTDVMYFGNMHVTKKGRGKGFFYRSSNFFFSDLPPGVDYFYAYIMEGNEAALDLIDRRHPRFPNAPFAKVAGKISMVSILLMLPIKLSHKYDVRPATPNDIDSIVGLLCQEHSIRFLAPEMSRNIFIKNLGQRPQFGLENYMVAIKDSKIVGVCSAWDMTSFKKNRILSYGRSLGMIRSFYNAFSPFLGIPLLPKPGEAFRDITIAEYAVNNRDPDIMEALLRYAYRKFRAEGYHSIIFGTSIDDPLLSAAKSFFSKEIRSNVIVSSKEERKLAGIEKIPLIYADAVQI